MNEGILTTLAIWTLPVVFAITLHEVSHGWVARLYGDHTAARLGRLSLNPLRHVDPIGTLLVPAVCVFIGGIVFGWARPVPVVTANLRNPRADMAKVAIAGPLSNLVMALLWGLVLRLSMGAQSGSIGELMMYMAAAGVAINLILMVLNLFPLPPLDGSRVVNGFLPEKWARIVDRVEPYGLVVLILLLMTGILGKLLWPLLLASQSLVLGLVGLGNSGLQIFPGG